jgi:hypothetical protein
MYADQLEGLNIFHKVYVYVYVWIGLYTDVAWYCSHQDIARHQHAIDQ